MLQQNAQQNPNRMQLIGQAGGQPGQGPPGQPMSMQQQQWYKQQQLMAMRQQAVQQQQQQQQQQFQQPPAPPYQQRLPAIRQPHMPYNNTFQEQQYQPMQGLKPTPPPVPSPQGVMGPPQGGISVQQQQLMQSVRSPPPIRSPQPNPSPRPAPSPRNQPVPSPRGPQPSPHDMATSEMLLGQNHTGLHAHASPASQNPDAADVPTMTPQDQLSKFVEQL